MLVKNNSMNPWETSALKEAIRAWVNMTDDDLLLISRFKTKTFAKGEFFNVNHSICRNLAFVSHGLFRIFYTDKKTGEDINLFFFSENQFMVSFKSFITQTPCYYTIEALEDSEVSQISHSDLVGLFETSHAWESFGRVLAEQYFYFSQERTESFLFKTAEQRYKDLLQLYPTIFERVPLYHISSYLGIKGPSLSRIRKRLAQHKR